MARATGNQSERRSLKYKRLIILFVCISVIAGVYILEEYLLISVKYGDLFGKTEKSIVDESSSEDTVGAHETTPKDGYSVRSPVCRIPDLLAYDEPVDEKKFLLECEPPLTKVESIGPHHLLRVTDNTLTCCYWVVEPNFFWDPVRLTYTDETNRKIACVSFIDNVIFAKEERLVKVKCTKTVKNKTDYGEKQESRTEVYINVHGLVRKTKSVLKKIKEQSKKNQRLNVMLVGVESVSRLNLTRTMPQTIGHLEQEGWARMDGYNGIGNNTYLNLMALLTGQTEEQLKQSCGQDRLEKSESCPFVWNKAAQKGYVTVLAEANGILEPFKIKQNLTDNTLLTDYYLRALKWGNGARNRINDTGKRCQNPALPAAAILDYAIDFTRTFQNDSYFGLFWMNNMNTNEFNIPGVTDKRFVSFFKDLGKTGALSTTLIVFLSDHGINKENDYFGWLEERLPFTYIWVPDYYKKLFPDKYANLKVNSNRLITSLDLHRTIQSVFDDNQNEAMECLTCRSLLEEIPSNRSCSDAGIEEYWCTCSGYKNIADNSTELSSLSQFLIYEINQLVQRGRHFLDEGTQCAILTIKNIISFRKIESDNVFVIIFETSPGEGIYEATLEKGMGNIKARLNVIRQNTFGKQSKCAKDSILRKYCFCVNN